MLLVQIYVAYITAIVPKFNVNKFDLNTNLGVLWFKATKQLVYLAKDY